MKIKTDGHASRSSFIIIELKKNCLFIISRINSSNFFIMRVCVCVCEEGIEIDRRDRKVRSEKCFIISYIIEFFPFFVFLNF
jgi:hypothetical protein